MQQIRSECENLRMKQDELRIQVQELTHECEWLKEEESRREEQALQIQQLQLECEHVRKRQEGYESERLKEKSQRRALTLQLQCNNFSLRTKHWRRKSPSSKVSLRQLTPSSPRWNNSAMNAGNVLLKMSRSQTARGKCARSWQKLPVYLLTQLAVASWRRLFSRRRKFLLRKWNWSLPTWRELQYLIVPPLNGSEYPIKFLGMCWVTPLNGSEYPTKFCWNTAGTNRTFWCGLHLHVPFLHALLPGLAKGAPNDHSRLWWRVPILGKMPVCQKPDVRQISLSNNRLQTTIGYIMEKENVE